MLCSHAASLATSLAASQAASVLLYRCAPMQPPWQPLCCSADGTLYAYALRFHLPRLGSTAPATENQRALSGKQGFDMRSKGLSGRPALSLLLAVFAGALLQPGLSQSDVSDYDPSGDVGYGTLQTFPFCRCDTYRCQASPYSLTYFSRTVVGNDVQMCFKFDMIGCGGNGYPMNGVDTSCCKMITDHMEKAEFEVDNVCKSQVKLTETTLDGVKKTAYFMTLFPTGTLRITQLDQENGVADGKLLCITTLKGPCDTPEVLFVSKDSSPTYAIFESSDHKPGNCCNQTLSAVTLSMSNGFQPAFQFATIYTWDGKPWLTNAQLVEYGLEINMPEMIYTDTYAEGEYFTIEIALDITMWADASTFPCKHSFLQPSALSCDYFIRGWQTVDGNGHTVLDGPLDAQCCAEGAVGFLESQLKDATCNTFMSDSPWRITFDSNTTTSEISTVSFAMKSLNVGPQFGVDDCSEANPEEVKIYINPDHAASLKAVMFDGVSQAVELKNDPKLYVAVATPGAKSGSIITLQYFASVAPATVCKPSVGTFSAPEYSLPTYSACSVQIKAMEGNCCMYGDVAIADYLEPLEVDKLGYIEHSM
eukprot:gene16269-22449_t